MGLDTTHGCWHGAYSSFHRWRVAVAKAAGFPPLEAMEGHWDRDALENLKRCKDGLWTSAAERILEQFPISWKFVGTDPLSILLHHSDCDGHIMWQDCGGIADRLEEILPEIAELDNAQFRIKDLRDRTEQFIKGLRVAYSSKENVEFG